MELLTLNEAISLDVKRANQLYKKHFNPGLLEVYKLLGMSEMDIESAEGVEIHLKDGRTILDFSSSIGVLGLGHNHPRIIAAEELCHKKKLIDAIKVAPHKLQAAFAYNLSQLLPDPLQMCFFSVSGAEAVEAGLKICERAQGPKKTKFITASGSFHGKTHGALSLTTSGGFQRGFLMGIPKENIVEVPYGDVQALAAAISENQTGEGENSIIAIILEPIQGQGLHSAPPGYLKEVVALCRENNILSIFDEVKVSMGRTGTFCAFQIENVVPDVVTISKSLGGGKRAVGAMITTEAIFNKAYAGRKDSSLHTTTFGGLGESCAVGIEALNVLQEENLIEGAREKGEYLKNKLLKLQEKHKGKIVEIMGRGLLQGIRFAFNKSFFSQVIDTSKFSIFNTLDAIMMASIIRELYQRYNIITHFSASDPDVLHVMPPLVVEYRQLDEFVDAIDDILERGLVKIVAEFVKGNVMDMQVKA
ncbi:aspartate aminotransferase family protein [Microcoleus sp. FACHB-831]|jgi:putrescine aminotransferase|uniref:aspartate aminotransferase family protein n=1 Tax=Microcoleus sp. FACHB-831 TaxID=2692827 RepID=UPI001688D4FB|nr:aminotransferase class III-fold pyridoxal phosphate-dependent enzyme [Microcoleus sp. FACHB-831]MBD1922273.1 aspartate aminotransferase family protein [Microcoleus sp. FACHB-831]